MFKLISLLLTVLLFSCSTKIQALECDSFYKKGLEVIDVFYLGDTSDVVKHSEVERLAEELKKCSKYDLQLRLELLEGYLKGLDVDHITAFEKTFDNWETYLVKHNFNLSTLPEVEGFTEYLNALRFVFKKMSAEQKNSELGLNLLNKQAIFAKDVLDNSSKLKWVLHNQYLNSLMNQLAFYGGHADNRKVCNVVKSIKAEIENKEYFTEKQLNYIVNKLNKKSFSHCL